MKAERLIAILTILLNRKKISASALARDLEVSIRTIYRDIEALAQAGIPVYATSGRDGGFELVEGFKMDSQLLETGEIRQILAGLQGISAVYPKTEMTGIIEKFSLILKKSGEHGLRCPENHIFIELTPSQREKKILELVEESITKKTVLAIRYTDASGSETARSVEPAALVFVWQSWYAWAWCRLRKEFRMFKVSRILGAERTCEVRVGDEADLESRPWLREWNYGPMEKITLETDTVARTKLAEFFDQDCIAESGSGRYRVTAFLPVDEWVVAFIMGLPGKVDIVGPETLRAAVAERARRFVGLS